MALTEAQTAYLDSKLGPDTWTEADLAPRIARTGDIRYAAREVLEGRLAGFRAQPAQYTIPGEYQQSTAENIHAIERALDDIPAPPASGDLGNPIRILTPDTSRWSR